MSTLQPRKLDYFDYLSVAREADIAEGDLVAIERGTRAEYGNDDMLFELRMLRTCMAIRDHHTSVQAVLAEFRRNEASAA